MTRRDVSRLLFNVSKVNPHALVIQLECITVTDHQTTSSDSATPATSADAGSTTRTLLLVCTGNTCRSPMAEAMAKGMLAHQLGVSVDALSSRGVHVVSAGVSAGAGSPPSQQAVMAMKTMGLDLSRHGSQPVTTQLVDEADQIYTMTQSHLDLLLRLFPQAKHKAQRLVADADIMDPFGGDVALYEKTAGLIAAGLKTRLKTF